MRQELFTLSQRGRQGVSESGSTSGLRRNGGHDWLGSLKRAFHPLVALVMCLHLCGGHLSVMQVVAWSGMFVTFSQRDGVALAARKTFDGAHPCALCKAIGDVRKAGQTLPADRSLPPPEWSKLGSELSVVSLCEVPPPATADACASALPDPEGGSGAFAPAPPTPPPRSCA